jgi:branched-chain amino acid transport system ATP-binding protein
MTATDGVPMPSSPQPRPAQPPALQLDGVTSGYGRTTVLRGISLQVPAGSITALLGPNGAGKSTLLKTASGLIRPTAGRIHLDGEDVTTTAPHQRARRGLCHIPEGRGIFRSLSVRENLVLQSSSRTGGDATEEALTVFPILKERLRQIAGTLSGGQQQMLALTRAYLSDPRLVLVDEASLGLAPLVVDEIFEFLANTASRGTALLIVDQFVIRALSLASTAYVLQRGELVFSGTSDELGQTDVYEQYLGSHRGTSEEA